MLIKGNFNQDHIIKENICYLSLKHLHVDYFSDFKIFSGGKGRIFVNIFARDIDL